MRSEIGTFSRILMKVFVFFFLQFYSSCGNGEGNTCKLETFGECTNAIITIDKTSAKEETSFNVCIYRQEIRELAVVLCYENGYICRETNDYKCTNRTDDTFTVTLGCAPLLQNVTLEGDGQQPMRCQPMETKSDPPLEIPHISEDSNCHCLHKRESGNSVDGSRQKRCSCQNASPNNPDGNPNNRIEDDNGGEVDNPKENGSLVLILGISLSFVISAAVVVGLLRYRKRMVLWWKKNRNEHIDKENGDTKDPLNSESTKC